MLFYEHVTTGYDHDQVTTTKVLIYYYGPTLKVLTDDPVTTAKVVTDDHVTTPKVVTDDHVTTSRVVSYDKLQPTTSRVVSYDHQSLATSNHRPLAEQKRIDHRSRGLPLLTIYY